MASNLTKRIGSAVFLVPLVLWILYKAPAPIFQAAFLGATALTAFELSNIILKKPTILQLWMILSTLAFPCLFTFSITKQDSISSLIVPTVLIVVMFTCFFCLRYVDEIREATAILPWMLAGPFYLGTLISSLPLLYTLPNGSSWIVFAMLMAFLSDTGGYFIGKKFGKHRLAPQISPNKTVEGSLGGILFSIGGALLAHFWFLPELTLLHAIILGLLATIAGQLGDLFESLIKRIFKVKDSGNTIPGHGGLLDRIDALLFTATITWLYCKLLL